MGALFLWEYIVFFSTQIKSVGNGGIFDLNDNNIYHQSAAYYPNKVVIDEGVVDLTDAFDSVPTSQEVKSYIRDVIEKGQEFITLSPEWVVDIPKGQRAKNKILNNGNYKHLSKPEYNRHKKYIMALEKLLENSRFLKTEPNKKKDKKSFVENYHYFSTFAKIGNKTYYVVFDVEQFANDNIEKPQKIHLYNATEIKIPPISGIGRNYAKREMGGNMDTISLSDENVNSDGKLYQKVYVSMKGELVGDYLGADSFEMSGEGAMVHGWGNYLLKDRKTNKVRYFDRWNERKIFYKKMMNHFVSVF